MDEEQELVQVTTAVNHQESREESVPVPLSKRIEGRVSPVRQGLLVTLSGWAALCSFVVWLLWLMGIRRTGRLMATGDLVTYEEEFVLFGLTVRRVSERFSPRSIGAFSLVQERPMFPVLFGAAGVLVGGTWGLLSMVEGVAGHSTNLFFLGLLVLDGALLCDFVLFWVAGRFGQLRSTVVVHIQNRMISLGRVRHSEALELARSFGLALGASEYASPSVG